MFVFDGISHFQPSVGKVWMQLGNGRCNGFQVFSAGTDVKASSFDDTLDAVVGDYDYHDFS